MTAKRRALDPILHAELMVRYQRDGAARRAYLDGGKRDPSEVLAVDTDNQAFLSPLIEQHGWLGADLTGRDGAHACWLLVQHSPAHLRAKCLPLLAAAVEDGLAEPRDLAYLEDRVGGDHGRAQRYGTQWLAHARGESRLWPLEDPDGVNDRRAVLGMQPLDQAEIALAWTERELRELG